ncbi:HEAT repeat domain-containing protein [Chondrinema litorale]|uniref:HEAT repeat domain-containing protein n=1 Tax=Chondrinema litorale TaxID=2994555 RepID=UPI002543C288|nr:HEAT repeat domain-containing protein [Chondrinema litorale]UZR94070.1 HEAT repeat domain-containing protein [Chondrinema litorale]
MEENQYKDKLIDYLEGTLSEKENKEIEQKLAENEALFNEYDELRIIHDSMDKSVEFDSPVELSKDFYSMLDEEIEKENNNKKFGKSGQWLFTIKKTWNSSLPLRIAASVALFLAGFFVDKQIRMEQIQTEEVQSLRDELNTTKTLVMLSLLKQQSASDRIMAVNYTYEMNEIDQRIVDALSETLATDQNTNVRMAACEALIHYKEKVDVQDVLLTTLSNQDDPSIQIMIIDALISLEDKRAVAQFEQLLEKQDVIDIVRNKAQEGIGLLL